MVIISCKINWLYCTRKIPTETSRNVNSDALNVNYDDEKALKNLFTSLFAQKGTIQLKIGRKSLYSVYEFAMMRSALEG